LKLLAFDTSTELCTAALWQDGGCRTRETMAGNQHSNLLLPMLEDLLAEAGLRLADLDGLAFGMGPGSFTGLRIGCGIAQGLALGADLPVVGVGTLEALAWGQSGECLLTCLDARMHEVYAATYRRVGDALQCEIAPGVFRPDAVPLPVGEGWIGCGSGFAAYAAALHTRLGAHISEVRADAYPHARAIAELALPRFLAGTAGSPDSAEPFYVRDKVALKTCERD
jgi:tRNA threonylcarbamoyladenosine biosynthesis protein TsaB